MANFYISPTSKPTLLYELHATTDISVSYPSQLTTYKLESGVDVADNVVVGPAEVSFNGILTNVSKSGFSPTKVITDKLRGGANDTKEVVETLKDYIDGLLSFQKLGETFSVFFSGLNEGDLADIPFAILTDFTINKNNTIGSSWEVSISLQEVRFASAAEVNVNPGEGFSSILAKSTQGAGTGASVDDQQGQTCPGNRYCGFNQETGKAIDADSGLEFSLFGSQ